MQERLSGDVLRYRVFHEALVKNALVQRVLVDDIEIVAILCENKGLVQLTDVFQLSKRRLGQRAVR